MAFSPDSKILASAGSDYAIRLWDVAATRPRDHILTGHTGLMISLAFSPDGRRLASAR